jgi:predicted glycoside hydrolase/deacetylase ChbG (UPF0249 family)
MERERLLVVVADDFGIGPETSRGILELALEGRVTATVLLVNSPHAPAAVDAWTRAGRPIQLGWHPCLTLDRPILPPDRVPSLVGDDGRLHPLGRFLRRVCAGRVAAEEVAAEFYAQYERFRELVGKPPSVVNAHQHVAVFPPVGRVLCNVLAGQLPRPYLRRVGEPTGTIARVPGAKIKRAVLTWLGRRLARRSDRLGLSGCHYLIGITDPPCVADERFYARWLNSVPGDSVELACHPGYRDETLIGRDCCGDDACVARRVHELHLLRSADFPDAVRRAGFRLAAPDELAGAGRAARAA